jgi:hypothetical protein
MVQKLAVIHMFSFFQMDWLRNHRRTCHSPNFKIARVSRVTSPKIFDTALPLTIPELVATYPASGLTYFKCMALQSLQLRFLPQPAPL